MARSGAAQSLCPPDQRRADGDSPLQAVSLLRASKARRIHKRALGRLVSLVADCRRAPVVSAERLRGGRQGRGVGAYGSEADGLDGRSGRIRRWLSPGGAEGSPLSRGSGDRVFGFHPGVLR